MIGYYTRNGYMGYVTGKGYQLFESESSYYEFSREIRERGAPYLPRRNVGRGAL